MSIANQPPLSTSDSIPVEEALRAVRSGIASLDASRADGYSNLVVFRSAKSALLTRHARLLTVKLGAGNSRVLDLQSQTDVIAAQLPDLNTAQALAAIPPVQAEATGYVLHGIIRGPDRQPWSGVLVGVADDTGKRRADFQTATTDANGYFRLETSQLIPANVTTGEVAGPPASVALTLLAFQGRQPLALTLPAIVAAAGNSQFVGAIAGAANPAVTSNPRQAGPVPSQSPTTVREKIQILVRHLQPHGPRHGGTASQPKSKMPHRASKTAGPAGKRPKSRKKRPLS